LALDPPSLAIAIRHVVKKGIEEDYNSSESYEAFNVLQLFEGLLFYPKAALCKL